MSCVLIVDDHPIVLQGCRRVLEDVGVGTVLDARDVASGFQMYCQHNPDVVIIDLALQDGALDGLQLVRSIRSRDPGARILVFSMHSDPILVSRALEAGALGYVLKDTSSDEIVRAFEKVRTGTPHLSQDLALQIAMISGGAHRNAISDLTPRELQTVTLLAQGKSYSLIADQLGISYKTVVNICYQLRQKLDAKTLPELVRTSIELLGAPS
jgi:two-component system, NarL family, invasion response regulator UvrY